MVMTIKAPAGRFIARSEDGSVEVDAGMLGRVCVYTHITRGKNKGLWRYVVYKDYKRAMKRYPQWAEAIEAECKDWTRGIREAMEAREKIIV